MAASIAEVMSLEPMDIVFNWLFSCNRKFKQDKKQCIFVFFLIGHVFSSSKKV